RGQIMGDSAIQSEPSSGPNKLNVVTLVRPYWKGLALAFAGVLGESLSDVLEPWPVKVVIDNVLHSKMPSGWLGRFVTEVFGADKIAILNFAVAAVGLIAILGAISSYCEKYLTTSVSQWVTHDLRRSLYNHIQQLSLLEHEHAQTGDLISRVTSDIGAVQDFINSALLGILVNLLTLVGMIGVMFYIDWRFTLIVISIVLALFFLFYTF